MYFPWDVPWIVGIDAKIVDGLATGTRHKLRTPFKTQQRAGFGHAIAHRIRQVYLTETLFCLGLQGSTAHDEAAYLTAKGCQHLLADEFVDRLAGLGYGHQPFHLVEGGLDGIGVHLLHYQRHRYHHIGLHLLHGFQQRCGRGCLAKEIDRHSIYIGMDELDSQSVHVGHREHGYNGLTGLVGEMAVAERIGV